MDTTTTIGQQNAITNLMSIHVLLYLHTVKWNDGVLYILLRIKNVPRVYILFSTDSHFKQTDWNDKSCAIKRDPTLILILISY